MEEDKRKECKCAECDSPKIDSLAQLEAECKLGSKSKMLEIIELKQIGGKTRMIVYPEFNKKWSIRDMVVNYCPPSWREMFLENSAIISTIDNRLKLKSNVLPKRENIFRIFRECPLYNVKVVIIAQDPYYTLERGIPLANGIAFSISRDQKLTSSLQNITKELKDEGYRAKHGDLVQWVKQGVFLLNTSLTVERGSPNSHKLIWRSFSERVIEWISHRRPKAAYLLWGREAQKLNK